jgi:hypothetical protein
VLDILAELDPQAADNVDAVICGHSHQPKIALRIPPALQLKREWSPWSEFGSDRGNPRDPSQG